MADMSSQGAELKKHLTFITVLVLIIFLVLVGGIITFFVMSNKVNVPVVVVKPMPTMGPLKNLGDFILNLADAGDPPRYIKFSLSIELRESKLAKEEDNDKVKTELKMREPQLKDMVISVVSSKTSQDISTEEGKWNLKNELKKRFNAVLATTEVVNVFFESFAIQ